jgi:hypothetical protein
MRETWSLTLGGRTLTAGVCEQDAEETTWTQEG